MYDDGGNLGSPVKTKTNTDKNTEIITNYPVLKWKVLTEIKIQIDHSNKQE